MSSSKNKGQVFSADFLIGIIVLLFILSALQVHQSNIIQKVEHQDKLLYRQSLVSRTDTLLMFEGIPNNWNSSNVEVLGFSTGEPNHINETKFKRFLDLTVKRSKELLGLRGRSLYISLENSTGLVIDDGREYSMGNKTWNGSENIYTVERKVVLEESDQSARLRLVVW